MKRTGLKEIILIFGIFSAIVAVPVIGDWVSEIGKREQEPARRYHAAAPEPALIPATTASRPKAQEVVPLRPSPKAPQQKQAGRRSGPTIKFSGVETVEMSAEDFAEMAERRKKQTERREMTPDEIAQVARTRALTPESKHRRLRVNNVRELRLDDAVWNGTWHEAARPHPSGLQLERMKYDVMGKVTGNLIEFYQQRSAQSTDAEPIPILRGTVSDDGKVAWEAPIRRYSHHAEPCKDTWQKVDVDIRSDRRTIIYEINSEGGLCVPDTRVVWIHILTR